MSRQRLLIIVVPALVVGGIEVVSDTLLDSVISFPLDAIVITLVVLVIAAALSGTAYRRIDSLRATLAARNLELEERAASASALRRVSVAITALVDLPEILDAIVADPKTDIIVVPITGAVVAFSEPFTRDLIDVAKTTDKPIFVVWGAPPGTDDTYYKRLLDGDRGPNTGGMGVYCPAPVLDAPAPVIDVPAPRVAPSTTHHRKLSPPVQAPQIAAWNSRGPSPPATPDQIDV